MLGCLGRSSSPPEEGLSAQLKRLVKQHGFASVQESLNAFSTTTTPAKQELQAATTTTTAPQSPQQQQQQPDNNNDIPEATTTTPTSSAESITTAATTNAATTTTPPPSQQPAPVSSSLLATDIMEASLDAMMVTNEQGILTRVNKSALKLFGIVAAATVPGPRGAKKDKTTAAAAAAASLEIAASSMIGTTLTKWITIINSNNTDTAAAVGDDQTKNTTASSLLLNQILQEGGICRTSSSVSVTSHRDQAGIRGTKRNGTRFPIQVRVQPIHSTTTTTTITHEQQQHQPQQEPPSFVVVCHDLTVEEEQSIEMEREEQLNQSILDSSFDAIVVANEEGEIVKVNASLVQTFGFDSVYEIVGQNISTLVGGTDGHAENHPLYMKGFKDRKETSTILGKQRQLVARRKDGTEFPCHIGIRKVLGSELLVGFIQDRTAEKQVEQEQLLNESILQASFEAILVADDAGNIIKANASVLTVFGFDSIDEVVGQNIAMLVGDEEHAQNHDMYMKRFKERGGKSRILGARRELVARRKNGSVFPCRIGIRKVDGTDMMVGFVHDLSHEVRSLELAVEKRAADHQNVGVKVVGIQTNRNTSANTGDSAASLGSRTKGGSLDVTTAWLGNNTHRANYSVSRCGPGAQCPALSQARFGFHGRCDTPTSNRPFDTLLSGTVSLHLHCPSSTITIRIDWDQLSYFDGGNLYEQRSTDFGQQGNGRISHQMGGLAYRVSV